MAATFTTSAGLAPFVLPAASISGSNPADDIGLKAGDIVHQRNGQILSVRSWGMVRTWSISMPKLTLTEVNNLRTFYSQRTFRLYPSGSGAYYDVFWTGVFNVGNVSPDIYSTDITLEQVTS